MLVHPAAAALRAVGRCVEWHVGGRSTAAHVVVPEHHVRQLPGPCVGREVCRCIVNFGLILTSMLLRPYNPKISAVQNVVVAVLTYGEGS